MCKVIPISCKCDACKGSGFIDLGEEGLEMCPNCDGRGDYDEEMIEENMRLNILSPTKQQGSSLATLRSTEE